MWMRGSTSSGCEAARRVLLAAVLLAICTAAGDAADNAQNADAAFDPTADYQVRQVEGWTVYVNQKLLAEAPLCERVLKLLQARLIEARGLLPEAALGHLEKVPIWMELTSRRFPGGCYHPSRRWLESNGVNPDKAGAIEFGNAANFLGWSRTQPAMILHELAHAYHHRVLTHADESVNAAFEQAKSSGEYEQVLYFNGERKRAYALNNAQEYFAELSEAYFSTNDFYPFVKPELKEHDPAGFEMVQKAWHKPAQ